jgi:uncharacterized protein YndB with AHSA1/START domain
MIKTKLSIIIRRPVADVFAYVTTIENFPRWSNGLIKESHQTSPGPVGAGTIFTQQKSCLGRWFKTEFEVVAYKPDQEFCVTSRMGSLPFQGCYTFEPVDEGTRFTHSSQVEASGFFSLVGSLLVGQIRKQTEANLASLKTLLEAARPPAPR